MTRSVWKEIAAYLKSRGGHVVESDNPTRGVVGFIVWVLPALIGWITILYWLARFIASVPPFRPLGT